MTTTEPTTEEALWQAIGAAPDDQLPRLVAADWYEERAGKEACKKCHNTGFVYIYGKDGRRMGGGMSTWSGPTRGGWPIRECPACSGTGYVPDRNGRLAAALRATVEKVPEWMPGHGVWTWQQSVSTDYWYLDPTLFARLSGRKELSVYCDYPTAAAAILDMCEAWCKVTYGEEVQE